MRVSSSSVVRASADVVSCTLGEGKALLDLRSSTVLFSERSRISGVGFAADPTGSWWDSRPGGARVRGGADRCEEDLIVLLDQFADAGLIVIEDEAP